MNDAIATAFCGHCGRRVSAHELAPMAHAPQLPACRACRLRVEVVGDHQRPFEPRHVGEHARRLAEPAIPAAGADLVAVV